MMNYTTYEPDFEGTYTSEGMHKLYNDIVDKSEYPDFECWIYDMLKSGIFVEIERR